MHTPFVLRAAPRDDAMDDDLPLAQRQVALVEQPGTHEAPEQPLVAGQHAEQQERRYARRHQGIEARLHLRRVWRLGGRNTRHLRHEALPKRYLCYAFLSTTSSPLLRNL